MEGAEAQFAIPDQHGLKKAVAIPESPVVRPDEWFIHSPDFPIKIQEHNKLDK
jgi:hypothetical protein